jgi:hypothetical protein
MSTPTTGSRALSIAAGAVFAIGALSVLFEDVVSHQAPIELKHLLIIITVLGTMLACHLFVEASRSWHIAAALGFGVLFVCGTALVVYKSAGKQAEATMLTAAQHEDLLEKRIALKAELEAEKRRRDQKIKERDAECATGEGPKCRSKTALANLYEESLAGYQARLDQLQVPEPVAPEAEQLGALAEALGYDKQQVKALAVLVVPFLTTLFLEFGSIVSFGYGFGHGRRETVSKVSKAKPKVSALDYTEVPKVSDRELEDLRRLLRRAGRPLSNNEVAALSGVVKSEASKRVQKAIEAGIVSKRRVGKEVAIALN